MTTVITVDVALWGLVIGTVLPIIVGIVTARFTPGGGKSIILLFLAAIIAIGQEVLAAGSFELKPTLLKFALLFLTSVGAHFGLLKPAGITGSEGLTSNVAPNGLTGLVSKHHDDSGQISLHGFYFVPWLLLTDTYDWARRRILRH